MEFSTHTTYTSSQKTQYSNFIYLDFLGGQQGVQNLKNENDDIIGIICKDTKNMYQNGWINKSIFRYFLMEDQNQKNNAVTKPRYKTLHQKIIDNDYPIYLFQKKEKNEPIYNFLGEFYCQNTSSIDGHIAFNLELLSENISIPTDNKVITNKHKKPNFNGNPEKKKRREASNSKIEIGDEAENKACNQLNKYLNTFEANKKNRSGYDIEIFSKNTKHIKTRIEVKNHSATGEVYLSPAQIGGILEQELDIRICIVTKNNIIISKPRKDWNNSGLKKWLTEYKNYYKLVYKKLEEIPNQEDSFVFSVSDWNIKSPLNLTNEDIRNDFIDIPTFVETLENNQ